MNLPQIPDEEEALEKVGPLATLLYEAFEAAILGAREFFEIRTLSNDPYLFPHLVRFFVKQWLFVRGQDVDCEPDDVPNSGLRFAFSDWDVRILKATHGTDRNGNPFSILPAPGRSSAKQAFYRQQLSFRLGTEDAERRFSSLNVVVLWDVTIGWNIRLFLACPKNGDNYRGAVETFWIVEIPTPISQNAIAAADTANADLSDLENITLPTDTDAKDGHG